MDYVQNAPVLCKMTVMEKNSKKCKKVFDKVESRCYYSKAVTERERRQEKRLKNLKKTC